MFKQLQDKTRRTLTTLTGAGLLAAAGSGQANLPTPINPESGSYQDGNWLQLIKGYIGDGAVILGLAIAIVGLLWVAYTAVAKFNECRTGKAEWSELGVLGIVGAAVLLFIMFLLNEAAKIIT
ncbi:TIGR03745 family integrating conjugative element membrane protein [Ectothiorhodospira shaposhnikovii]|uniref:TIGR03745 family integrating conjugative element membrane protein n=1 Tax=Ectothiorhodospira shaposhnikovii TaxID=1054 RepID=UPI001908A36F|nr:TIGR03745 family integrating conjugative element membrane protein [Ectothiorhodospira shaposhnikovii]MBK1674805.1 TIGR03745 family integrating conjugative element membrane protein [Ectothiorhodospira shaposhnikovii]